MQREAFTLEAAAVATVEAVAIFRAAEVAEASLGDEELSAAEALAAQGSDLRLRDRGLPAAETLPLLYRDGLIA